MSIELLLCAFPHSHPDDAVVVAVMRSGPYEGMGLCEKHWAAVEDASDGD